VGGAKLQFWELSSQAHAWWRQYLEYMKDYRTRALVPDKTKR